MTPLSALGMKMTKTTKKEDKNENNKEEERVGRIRFELCWWIQEEHCGWLFRNPEGKCQRDFQAEVNADECHRVHESYELKWAGERDADEYSKKAAK